MATDPDEADLFFSAYQKNANESKETFHAIKRIHAAPKMRVNYMNLLNTIWEIWKIPPKDASPDDIAQALYLLSRRHKGGVEIDPVSCRASGVDPVALSERIRHSLSPASVSLPASTVTRLSTGRPDKALSLPGVERLGEIDAAPTLDQSGPAVERNSQLVVLGSSRRVTIVRAAGTPEELRWDTEMGGDFDAKALFQAPDRVLTGDEIHCDIFDRPRIVARVKPKLLADGEVAYWEAAITPRLERSQLAHVSVNAPPKLVEQQRPDFPDPFQPDANDRPLGDNPFPPGHQGHEAFEESKRGPAKTATENHGTEEYYQEAGEAARPTTLMEGPMSLLFGDTELNQGHGSNSSASAAKLCRHRCS
jgi:hypothetical protein